VIERKLISLANDVSRGGINVDPSDLRVLSGQAILVVKRGIPDIGQVKLPKFYSGGRS